MTATDELRRMLDERGVEHYDTENGTYWGEDGPDVFKCNARERFHNNDMKANVISWLLTSFSSG